MYTIENQCNWGEASSKFKAFERKGAPLNNLKTPRWLNLDVLESYLPREKDGLK